MVSRETIRTVLITTALFMAVAVLYQGHRFYKKMTDYARVSPRFAYFVDGADVTVVEFADYGCSYCREVHTTILEAIQRDGKVSYVPRIVPYHNPDAALLAYAAGKQGKFMEMHDILMREDWTPTVANIYQLAERLHINPLKLQDDFAHESTKNLVRNNIDLFEHIGTGATPTFVIGQHKIYVPEDKMPTVDDFIHMFDAARQER